MNSNNMIKCVAKTVIVTNSFALNDVKYFLS